MSKTKIKLTKSPQDSVHPVYALPARCALAARLVLVERHQPGNGLDYVSLLVHYDDGSGAEAGLGSNQRVEVHQDFVTNTGMKIQLDVPSVPSIGRVRTGLYN